MINNIEHYSGSDYLCILNGEINDKFNSIKIDSMSSTIEITIILDKNSNIIYKDEEMRKIKDGELVEVFLNDEGESIFKKYYGLNYIGNRSNKSINSLYLNTIYIFNYCSCSEYFPIKSLSDLIRQEKESFKLCDNNA